ncbi:MAG: OmpA family protein, partial [Endomicrobia bacterium]|nr:OmpA family protein [Endomicrobiia bacterium]
TLAEAKKRADEETKAAELARRQTEAEEKEANKKADEKAKAEALIKKQAEKDEKAKVKKEAAELKAKQEAEEKERKKEEAVQKQKEKEAAAAEKASEKAEKGKRKRESSENEAREKIEYETAQKIAAAELAVREKVAKEAVQTENDVQAVSEQPFAKETEESLEKFETAAKTEPDAAGDKTAGLHFVFLQSRLFAGSSQFELTPDGVREVWRAAEEIKNYIENNNNEKFKVMVEGYTDSTGGAEINMQYSLKRAAAVANELADSDIDFEIIEPKGFGAENFVNKENTASAENRRVEIKVISVE